MPWSGSIFYVITDAVSAAVMNAVNHDVRFWGGNVDAGGNALVNLNAIALVGTRPTIQFLQSGGVSYRIIQPLSNGWVDYAFNAYYDGTNWQRDDVSKPSSLISHAQTSYSYYYTAAGSGAITWVPMFAVDLTTGIQTVPLASVPVYANNAAAVSGGLTAGQRYRTGANPDPICIVH